MKRMACIFSALIMLMGIIGCGNLEKGQFDISTEKSSSLAIKEENSDTNNSMPNQDTETMKYFKYFQTEPTETLFVSCNDEYFDDNAMSAFAISKAIAQDQNFDFEKGVSPTVLDEIAAKYFDKKVSSYDNKYTSVLPSGNIVAAGWSPSPYDYVLKEISETDSGAKIATFYKVGGTFLEDITYEEYVQSLMNMEFDKIGKTYLVEISFYEKQDENGEYYLQFIYAKYLEN